MNWRILVGVTMALATSAFALQPVSKQAHAWDIAVLDRLLASAPSTSRTVRAGDMILLRSYVQAARDFLAAGGTRPESAFDGGVMLWPSGVVPYVFANDITSTHQKAFLDAAADWATFANVSFVARTNQADYVLVQNGLNGDNSSAVGKVGGQQVLNIYAWSRARSSAMKWVTRWASCTSINAPIAICLSRF